MSQITVPQVCSDVVVNSISSRYLVKSSDLITSLSNSTLNNNTLALGVVIKYSGLQQATITCLEEQPANREQEVLSRSSQPQRAVRHPNISARYYELLRAKGS